MQGKYSQKVICIVKKKNEETENGKTKGTNGQWSEKGTIRTNRGGKILNLYSDNTCRKPSEHYDLANHSVTRTLLKL